MKGPFARGLILRYVVLGRISETDELSADLETWLPLADHPELVPSAVFDDDERLPAMRRWESERVRSPAAAGAVAVEERRLRADEVRRPVSRNDDPVTLQSRRGRLRGIVAGIGLAMLLAVSVAPVFREAPAPALAADCTASPRPGVVWNSCDLTGRVLSASNLSGARLNSAQLIGAELGQARLEGADLSFANLTLAGLRGADLGGAQLKGASLRGAALDGARLDGADLSWADLRGASLEQASLHGARLEHALWIDGTVCAEGSLGQCLHASRASFDPASPGMTDR